jgi:hypothetical protein
MKRLDHATIIHGYAGGAFGRDSYACRRVEAIGPDWVVTRNRYGVADFAPLDRLNGVDIDDRSWCDEECTG